MNIKNLDHDEVNKFDELAAKWWDKDGEFRPLHQINPLRVSFIKERSSMEGKKVLDVGCGGGILAEALNELGASVTGIDASENTIGVAKTHSKSIGSDVKYIQNTIEEFTSSHPDERFDVITCLEMLEHVPSPYEIIKSCSNLLKEDGDIFFSTINVNPLNESLNCCVLTVGTNDPKFSLLRSSLDLFKAKGVKNVVNNKYKINIMAEVTKKRFTR